MVVRVELDFSNSRTSFGPSDISVVSLLQLENDIHPALKSHGSKPYIIEPFYDGRLHRSRWDRDENKGQSHYLVVI